MPSWRNGGKKCSYVKQGKSLANVGRNLQVLTGQYQQILLIEVNTDKY